MTVFKNQSKESAKTHQITKTGGDAELANAKALQVQPLRDIARSAIRTSRGHQYEHADQSVLEQDDDDPCKRIAGSQSTAFDSF